MCRISSAFVDLETELWQQGKQRCHLIWESGGMKVEEVLTGDEREQLEAFVYANRDEVAELLDGLTEEQGRRRLVPSQTRQRAPEVWRHP